MNMTRILDILSGREKSIEAGILRGILTLAEPFYAGVMSIRNWMYDEQWLGSFKAPMPVVSVGNITSGGTGKTPMTHWLVKRLSTRGYTPAVLLRGYKSAGGESDEVRLLKNLLGERVHANPDRVKGANEVQQKWADTNLLILDDGFQHRRIRRDFNLVMVDATEPFGFGHVLPRGLLREPLAGLARADALVISRSDQIAEVELKKLEERLHGLSPRAGIYRARHQWTGLARGDGEEMGLDGLKGVKWIAAAGIGNPGALEKQLQQIEGEFKRGVWFEDHYNYKISDVTRLLELMKESDAQAIVVTEKDWVKLEKWVPELDKSHFFRLKLEMSLDRGDGLIDLLMACLEKREKENRPS